MPKIINKPKSQYVNCLFQKIYLTKMEFIGNHSGRIDSDLNKEYDSKQQKKREKGRQAKGRQASTSVFSPDRIFRKLHLVVMQMCLNMQVSLGYFPVDFSVIHWPHNKKTFFEFQFYLHCLRTSGIINRLLYFSSSTQDL